MHAFAVLSPEDPAIVDLELPTPVPTGSEVLLRTLRAGVCHSDVHMREAGIDMGRSETPTETGVTYPAVFGHEIVGIVEAVGPDVTDVKVGDHRLAFPWIGDGTCEECLAGRENLCMTPANLGVGRSGGYADHVMVPHERYLLDIEGLDEGWAATLACSGLTSYSAVRKALPESPDAAVVVIGAGGVGLMAVAALRALGHKNIIAVDLQERNLELATGLGATATVSASEENLPLAIMMAAGGPAASAIDFVNNGSTAMVAFGCTRRGGKMVQVGLFGGELVLPTALIPLSAKTIQGNYVGTLSELQELVTIAKGGSLPKLPIIEAPLTAQAAGESLDKLKAGGVPGRIVLSA